MGAISWALGLKLLVRAGSCGAHHGPQLRMGPGGSKDLFITAMCKSTKARLSKDLFTTTMCKWRLESWSAPLNWWPMSYHCPKRMHNRSTSLVRSDGWVFPIFWSVHMGHKVGPTICFRALALAWASAFNWGEGLLLRLSVCLCTQSIFPFVYVL